jgi:hypothetical protein
MNAVEAVWEPVEGLESCGAIALRRDAPRQLGVVEIPAPTFSVGATAFIALTSAVAGAYVAWNMRDWIKP